MDTANRHEDLFWGDRNVLKLVLVSINLLKSFI